MISEISVKENLGKLFQKRYVDEWFWILNEISDFLRENSLLLHVRTRSTHAVHWRPGSDLDKGVVDNMCI